MSDIPPRGPDRLREIFLRALEISSPTERQAYLNRACQGDEVLRQRLQSLLDHHTNDSFLEDPAAQPEAIQTLVEILAAPADGITTLKLDSPDAPEHEGIGSTIGRYKLREKVGEGGCGVVYVAEQTEPVRRRVALKLIKLGMDTREVIARFEAERQALAMMDHPNIAKVLDAGTTPFGRPYFVMELVRGIRITDYCDQANLSTKERLDLFIKVCQAVQHAHQKGIIHRDIKPSNILVTLHDGVPVPKVIDFGIAKATEGRLTEATVYTQLHQFMGTPAYMSPEQAEMSGLDIDTRSDIYSLGVLLYQLLTSKTPFDGKELLALGLDQMRRTIREEEPMRPSTRLASLKNEELTTTAKRHSSEAPKLIHLIQGDLDWIVMKCLEKDRTRRYETANGLATDISRHLTNEPVLARPPSATYKFQKMVRRNKTAFAAVAAVVMTLLLGVIVSTWQAAVATRAKNEAIRAQAEKAEEARVAQEQRRKAEAAETSVRQLLYSADMKLIQQSWNNNDLGNVRHLLERTASYPGRGFEWAYWQRQSHLETQTLSGHQGNVGSAAFSPDGLRIVTGGWDNVAKVWETSTVRELFTLLGHTGAVESVSFSPDGGRILTGSDDGTIKIWDSFQGKCLLTISGEEIRMPVAVWAPDGKTVAAGDKNGVQIWDSNRGNKLSRLTGGGGHAVLFSPDGNKIAASAAGDSVTIWDIHTTLILRQFVADAFGVGGVAFSMDSKRVLTGGADKIVREWDISTGQQTLSLEGHTETISCVNYSPNGQVIVTGSTDRTARTWETSTGKGLQTLKGHEDILFCASFSPDSRTVLTGSQDRTAKLWTVITGRTVPIFDSGMRIAVNALSSDGASMLARSGSDWSSNAEIWSIQGEKMFSFKVGATNGAIALSQDWQRVVASQDDQTLDIWDLKSGRMIKLPAQAGGSYSAAFSWDGHRLASGGGDQSVKIWDVATGREVLNLPGHSGGVSSIAFSPDGRKLVTSTGDRVGKIWDASLGKELISFRTLDIVSVVAFSPDSKTLVMDGNQRSGSVRDVATGEEIARLRDSGGLWHLQYSPDGKRIVGAGYNKGKLWEASTGNELLTLNGHWSTFSPDGQSIITIVGNSRSKEYKLESWTAATPAELLLWKNEPSR